MINKCLVECPPLVFVLEKLLLLLMDKKRNHAIETRHCDAAFVLSKCVACGGCPTRCHRAGPLRPSNSLSREHFDSMIRLLK